MKSLFILAVLIGVASCIVYPTFKQEMLDKMNHCEAKLNEGHKNATFNGFKLYHERFNDLLVVVRKVRFDLQQLADNASSKDYQKLFETTIDLFNLVNMSVDKPFPTEHLKARVLYLAVVKASFNLTDVVRKLQKDVDDVITQEILVSTHPNGWVHERFDKTNVDADKLTQMYDNLTATLKDEVAPTFDDHYVLISKTNAKIAVYERLNKTDEAKKYEEYVKNFSIQTILLANKFPIRSPQAAHQYFSNAMDHYKLRLTLTSIPYGEPTVKEMLLMRLDVLDKLFEAAIEKYKDQGLNVYANIMSQRKAKVGIIREKIQRMLAEDVDEQGAKLMEYEVLNLEHLAPQESNPSQRETLKFIALYLSSYFNTKTHPTGEELYKQVQEIVEFDAILKTLPGGYSAADRVYLQAQNRMLTQKYDNLVDLINLTNITVNALPTPSEHQSFMQKAEKKIEDFAVSNMVSDAATLRYELNQYLLRNIRLNQLLPIDTKPKMDEFVQNCKHHYQLSKSIEKLMEKPTNAKPEHKA